MTLAEAVRAILDSSGLDHAHAITVQAVDGGYDVRVEAADSAVWGASERGEMLGMTVWHIFIPYQEVWVT